MEYKFVFDLDSTITKKEILPTIAERFGLGEVVGERTEAAMRGEVPFEESFRRRVALLSDCQVSEAARIVAEIPLNEHIAAFIRENSDRCYIATGNLDVWIEGIVSRLGLSGHSDLPTECNDSATNHVFCSKTVVLEDRIAEVSEVFGPEQKAELVRRLTAQGKGHDCQTCKVSASAEQHGRCSVVAIGDGANDIKMCSAADIGIAFGGAREVPEGLRSVCAHTFYDDKECAAFLNKLIK